MSSPSTPTRPRASGTQDPGRASGGRTVAGAAALDVAAVVVFVVVGRRSHTGGLSLEGVVRTASPFLLALVIGWLSTRAWRSPVRWRTGVAVALSTVVLGLLFRLVDRGSVPLSFAVVTTITLGVLLLGWRGVARPLLARR